MAVEEGAHGIGAMDDCTAVLLASGLSANPPRALAAALHKACGLSHRPIVAFTGPSGRGCGKVGVFSAEDARRAVGAFVLFGAATVTLKAGRGGAGSDRDAGAAKKSTSGKASASGDTLRPSVVLCGVLAGMLAAGLVALSNQAELDRIIISWTGSGSSWTYRIAPHVLKSDDDAAHSAHAMCTMPLHAAQRTALFDIRNVSTLDVAGCCAACQAEPRCRYFEFETQTKVPRCWLKTSGAGPKRTDKTCTSGGITPPTPPPPPPPGPCKDDDGCSLCGTCDVPSGKCACDRGFTGANCELLSMGKPYKCGAGGLCMHGEAVGSKSGVAPTTAVATWGGSVVPDADFSEFHMCTVLKLLLVL